MIDKASVEFLAAFQQDGIHPARPEPAQHVIQVDAAGAFRAGEGFHAQGAEAFQPGGIGRLRVHQDGADAVRGLRDAALRSEGRAAVGKDADGIPEPVEPAIQHRVVGTDRARPHADA